MRIQQLEWKDDHVFGRSTTTGSLRTEAENQRQLLSNIHLTAQQQVTGEDELLEQAKHLIGNVAALVHLTETVQMRQPKPIGMDSSTSDYDSGYTSKTQQKRARKMARRGENKRHGPPVQTQVQPRHLKSRYGGQKSYEQYSQANGTYDPTSGSAEGMRIQGTVYYPSETPSSISSASLSYPSEYQQLYYSWSPDQSSHGSFTTTWPAWHPSVSLLSNPFALITDSDSPSVTSAWVFCQWSPPESRSNRDCLGCACSPRLQIRHLPHVLDRGRLSVQNKMFLLSSSAFGTSHNRTGNKTGVGRSRRRVVSERLPR
jgi:hypothetical protein